MQLQRRRLADRVLLEREIWREQQPVPDDWTSALRGLESQVISDIKGSVTGLTPRGLESQVIADIVRG